ncbi:MAG: ABC transporter ATP-binding protein/permease [Spirochaetes bacterium]|nr:ABC transporter ATP-binding protein/permease [Spirochaetota bacterium]MBU0954559.1 ABC transporter ATP-binding protein/permease [Spirochaetota bacterium]
MNLFRYRLALLKLLYAHAYGVRRFFGALVVVSGLALSLAFIQPLFYRIFVDDVIIGRDLPKLSLVLIGYLCCTLTGILLDYLKISCENSVVRLTMYRLKRHLLEIYMELPFVRIGQRSPGDMKLRIDDDMELFSGFGNVQVIDYVRSYITALVAGIMLFRIHWALALFACCAIPLTFFIDYRISLKEKLLIETNRINADAWQSWLLTSLQGWKTVKSLNLQRHEAAGFVRFAHNYALFFGRWINYWSARTLVIPRLKDEFFMKFAVFFLGGLLIARGNLSIGSLLVFSIYFDLLAKSIKTVSTCNAELRSNSPVYDRVLSEFTSAPERTSATKRPLHEHGSFSIRNLSFAYPGGEPLFQNFSAEIRQGEQVAIVGKSGVGKTTLIKLMVGMLEPQSGEVLFNDIDVRSLDPMYLFDKIGVVMQENLLFNCSIRENLLLADEHAKPEMLEKVCALACIDDFIRQLPLGFDTIIGEKGVRLSGGQKQRLVLARLLLRKVEVILFDEATSALDQGSERSIFAAISRQELGKTCIVVAHRESSLEYCTRRIALG